MAFDAHQNFAYSTVGTAPVPANSGTSLTLAAGGGALMPTPPFNGVVWPVSVIPLSSNAEIVRVTNIVGDVLTIVRTQESSSARSIVVGDQFSAAITKKTITDIEVQVPGPAGSIGPPGMDGLDGIDGDIGPVGPPGATGAVGPQGVPGLDGLDGIDGIDGLPGVAGAAGAAGLQGVPGMDGLDGDASSDPWLVSPMLSNLPPHASTHAVDSDIDAVVPPELYVKDEFLSIGTLLVISQLVWLDSTVQTWMSYQDYNPVGSPIVFPGTMTITMENPLILTSNQVIDLTGNPLTILWADAARYPNFAQYDFLKITVKSVGGTYTWTPDPHTRMAFVECIGAGGAGGGAATASSNLSCGSGGGGGGYAAKVLTGANIVQTSYTVGTGGTQGAAGAAGNDGNPSTFIPSVLIAAGGGGGSVLAAGTTATFVQGGGGGLLNLGDIAIVGGTAENGLRFSGTVGWGGAGGGSILCPCGSGAVPAISGGFGGQSTNGPGTGGGGAATISTAAQGAAGADGFVRITEYA